jgi:hypothetical protein
MLPPVNIPHDPNPRKQPGQAFSRTIHRHALAGICFSCRQFMRFAALSVAALLAGFLLTGCAAAKKPASATAPPPAYQDRAAPALAFTPPIAQAAEHIDLPRAERQPAIFVGFDALTETFFYVRTDDRFTNDGSDRFIRRSVQERVGVSYR